MLLKINAVSSPHVLLPTEKAPEGWALFPLRAKDLLIRFEVTVNNPIIV